MLQERSLNSSGTLVGPYDLGDSSPDSICDTFTDYTGWSVVGSFSLGLGLGVRFQVYCLQKLHGLVMSRLSKGKIGFGGLACYLWARP